MKDKMKLRRIFFRFGILTTWMIVIYVLSDQAGLAARETVSFWFYIERKGAHITEYFILLLLSLWSFRLFLPWRKAILLAMTLSFAYAVSDEIHQGFVPGREGKITDVMFDTVGIVLGCVASRMWRVVFPNQ